MTTRGFFEIGIFHSKTPANVGTLWRSAYQLGAAGIFTVGKRYPDQASDTVKAHRHIPSREFRDFDAMLAALPSRWKWAGVRWRGSVTPSAPATYLAPRITAYRHRCWRAVTTSCRCHQSEPNRSMSRSPARW